MEQIHGKFVLVKMLGNKRDFALRGEVQIYRESLFLTGQIKTAIGYASDLFSEFVLKA